MRVLVCGSRDWTDEAMVSTVLDGLYVMTDVEHGITGVAEFVVIEGGAKGADGCAKWWAEQSPLHSHNERPGDVRFEHLVFPADWATHGKAAGAIRNRAMLTEGKPDLVVAFKDGFNPAPNARGGTEHMARIARNAGITVWLMAHG